MNFLTLAAAFLLTVVVWGAQITLAVYTGTTSASRLSFKFLSSGGASTGRSSNETLYCNQESTATMLARLNDGATVCDLSSSSVTQCSNSGVCTEVRKCTRWACDAVSQSLVQMPCAALCQHRKRVLVEAGVDASTAAGNSTHTIGDAAVYLVLAGGTAVDATRYGINVSYMTVMDTELRAKLSSILPPGVTLIDGVGITTLTWDNLTASGGLPSLEGSTNYLELHIPAPGLDFGKSVGCLSYNATNNNLRTAAGNIVGLPAEAVVLPASYNSSTGEVICRLMGVVGTYVVAEQQGAVINSGGSSNTSNSASGGSGGGDGAQGIVALVIACTVGGIMAVPLTVLAITVCIMRKRRLQNQQNASGQWAKPQGLTPTGRAGSASCIAVHPMMGV